jgi:LAGLIDADG DNA endonuclease family protein
MILCPTKYETSFPDLNKELFKVNGSLEDKEAKIMLAKFLRHNLGLTTYLLSGIRLPAYQEILLKAFFNRNFSLLVAGRGCGKSLCYNDNTYLLTKEYGLITIIDLLPNIEFKEEDYWYEIPGIHLWNGKDWQYTNKILIQKNKKCLNIKTKMGYEIGGSTEHIIKGLNNYNNNCNITWKKFNELKENDSLCIDRSNVAWGDNTNIDTNEAYLLGLLTGDGCLVAHNWNITSADKQIIDFCTKYTSLTVRKINNHYSLGFSKPFIKYLTEKYNIKCCTSYFKEIPQKILVNSELSKAFLQGLLDTDGWIDNVCRVGFGSTSTKLAKQVHHVLNLFGVISKRFIKKTNSKFGKFYCVEFSGKTVLTFKNNINFRLNRKIEKLSSVLTNRNFNTNIDIVPGVIACLKEIRKENPIEDWKYRVDNNIRKFNSKNVSFDSVGRIIKYFDEFNIVGPKINNLKEIYKTHFFYDPIINKEETYENCIDFNIPTGECYWSNGFINHNSFIASLYCFLQCIFEPNTHILIAGPTFRTSRFIFEKIEQIVDSKEGTLLAQAFGTKIRRNDLFEWKINGGSIKAIPLNGEKIRGFRANVLVLDEFLLLPEEIIKNVLMPFITVPQNVGDRLQITRIENSLIKRGIIRDEDRTVFENTNKMIALSSASYTFENLYKVYEDWISKIHAEKGKEHEDNTKIDESLRNAKYFVGQLSYQAIPQEMLDPTIIDEAKSSSVSDASFLREYCAQFTDGSASYFSALKMKNCTFPFGENPHAQLFGNSNSKYILSIDPSFSSSPTSDYFSMSIFLLDDEKRGGTLVHSYAVAGGDLKDHIGYFYYLVNCFNIVAIIADNADGNFIDSANQSKLFKDKEIEYKFFEFDSEQEGQEYDKQLRDARRQYNLDNKKICFKQYFTPIFIRRANELLQTNIDKSKIWFASSINGNDNAIEYCLSQEIPIENIKTKSAVDSSSRSIMMDLIDALDININGTKKEASLIEVKSNPQGHQTFDLPMNLKRQTGPNRARKDRYTALLLGNWAIKCYYDILNAPKQDNSTFKPIMIR